MTTTTTIDNGRAESVPSPGGSRRRSNSTKPDLSQDRGRDQHASPARSTHGSPKPSAPPRPRKAGDARGSTSVRRGRGASSATKPGAAGAATDEAVATARSSPPLATAAAVSGSISKKATCLAMLIRVDGASIAELMNATGWQAHSVRGFLSGEVRRRMGMELASTVTEQGDRRYRIAGPNAG